MGPRSPPWPPGRGPKRCCFWARTSAISRRPEQAEFLRALAGPLTPADRLLVGFDLRKDPRRVRAAYDDAQGVTAEFNFNLLRRLNAEAGADFDLAQWQHFPDYDPSTGAMRSWLVSRRAQPCGWPPYPAEPSK